MKTETKNLTLFYIGSFLISLLSAYFIWLQTSRYGIGLSPDSVTYLRLSESISKEGLIFIIQNKDATFPPLYPLVLALFSNIFHADHISFARWFNIALSFCFTFLSIFLVRKLTKNLALLFVFGLFISFSRSINLVFSHAWSEPLFIFLLLLITFTIEKTNYKNLILCSFLSTLAILTRYAGVAIVPAVCLYLFIQKNGLPEKVKKCFCYSVIPTSTYIIYLIRNYYFTKTLMGHRAASNTGLISNCDRAFSTVAFWFSPDKYFFMSVFLILILGAFVWNYKEDLISYVLNSQKIVIFSACFSLVYSSFIIISSTTIAYDLINNRLMSPIFLSILLLLFTFILFCTHIVLTAKKREVLAYSMLSIFIVCQLLSFANTWKQDIFSRQKNGAEGYTSTFWQENELLDYIKKHKNDFSATIYSNDPRAFFVINRNIKAKLLPLKKYYNSNETTGITLENLSIKIPDFENSYLVYFNSIRLHESFSLEEFQSVCKMENIVENSDGFIFKVNACDTNYEERNF